MNYAFTGPSKLTDEQERLVRAYVLTLHQPKMIITGAAYGTDTVACMAALTAWPQAEHLIVVPSAPHNDKLVKDLQGPSLALVGRKVTILPVPPGDDPSRSYRARNAVMIEMADVLIAFLRSTNFYRSGEWMTTNMAIGRPVSVRKVILP